MPGGTSANLLPRVLARLPLIALPALVAVSAAGAVPGPAPAASQEESGDGLLVVLSETGETRQGLPVYAVHPEAERIAAALDRGLPATMVRIYRLEQVYLERARGIAPEPAYLLMSNHQGGYARYGFFLGDERKDGVAYVDVYRGWPLTGSFGAIDQLFPHELAHAMRRQLVGPMTGGFTNQVHALGVRTDRAVAFNEGFAEHFQALAIDDSEADPATRALGADLASRERVRRRLDAYRRELTATLAFATPMRLGFLAWFSNAEDVLRYSAVKANAYGRRTDVPDRLLASDDPYRAYLLESVLPGEPGAPPETVGRMVAIEGVVSALFYRWVTDDGLRDSYRDEAFYARFGTRRGTVTPLENAYLKVLHVFHVHRPNDVLELIAGYRETFVDEAPLVDAVVEEIFLGQPAEAPAQIWLANPGFATGTTLFDQLRGLPRTHTFDLNAASIVDLVAVPGVDPGLARAILAAAPYASVEDLRRVSGVDDELIARLDAMRTEVDRLLAAAHDAEEALSLTAIMVPYLWRIALAALLAATLGAIGYRTVRSRGSGEASRDEARRSDGAPTWFRSGINGAAAALVGLIGGWAGGWMGASGIGWSGGIVGSLAAAGVLFGLPGALWCLGKTREAGSAARVLAAWLAAAIPAAVLVTPWF